LNVGGQDNVCPVTLQKDGKAPQVVCGAFFMQGILG